MINVGRRNKLVVDRKSDLGYMLKDVEGNEVLLHFNQALRELENGEKIEVFIYLDSKKRISATMIDPFIEIDKPGFLDVVNVDFGMGVFVFNNTPKDLLISSDDLPSFLENWPEVGDKVLCKLKYTKTQLIAKLVTPEEAKDVLAPTTPLNKFDKVDAYVIKSGAVGINLLSLDGHSIFVYYKHTRRNYRIGELVNVTINNIRTNNLYNGSLIEHKLKAMSSDADIILNYLNDYDGFMPFTSKSSVEEIETTFNMSKASFKRALGNLYKQRIIDIKENGTYLVK